MGRVSSEKLLDIAIAVVSVGMCVYHLASAVHLLQSPLELQNTHLFFALVLVFLTLLKRQRRLWPLVLTSLLATIVSLGYVQFFFAELEMRAGIPTTADMIIGAIIIALVFLATGATFGKFLTLLSVGALVYLFFGQYIPGFFWHTPLSIERILSNCVIGFKGIYGTALMVSAKYIVLFILFGSLLRVSGASKCIMIFGQIVATKLASGPGMMAVATSALVGGVSGSAMANVALTGPITIPLMKRHGWKPEQAGAIEAVASTGGQIMPPVMGVTAFVMAEMLGVPYIQICAFAIIPTLLYFFTVGMFVQFGTRTFGATQTTTEEIKLDNRELMVSVPLFIIPLAVLMGMLIIGFTPMSSAFWATAVLIGLSLIRKESRQSFRAWVNGFVDGARGASEIAVAAATLGVIMSALNITGVALKMASVLVVWSGGHLIVLMGLTAVLAYIVGCAVPPLIAYLSVILMTAPAFVELGVGLIQAHFFIFFCAVFAIITPPVALGVVVACRIAESEFWRTALEAMKAGMMGFLLPFLVIWCPWMILQHQTSIVTMIFQALAILILIVAGQAAMHGHYLAKCKLVERVMLGFSAVLSIAYCGTQILTLFVIGVAIFAIVTLWQVRTRGASG